MRSSLQRRLDDFLQALGENFSAPFEIRAKPALLRRTSFLEMKNVTRVIPTTRKRINRRLSLTIVFLSLFSISKNRSGRYEQGRDRVAALSGESAGGW